MRTHRVYRDALLHVQAEKCPTCIFRPGGLELAPGRLRSFTQEHLRAGTVIVCHELYESPAPAVCRGFYDLGESAPLQLAERLGVLRFQNLMAKGHSPDGREER